MPKKNGANHRKAGTERIPWHSAFFEAIMMELKDFSQVLHFESEHHLTTEPLRIDVVIIKNSGNVPIKKNIAAMFRNVNIVEYKSPSDYVSVKDFYMVYGYASLYVKLENVDITDLTLTFVGSRYPRKLMTHLKEVRGYAIEETLPGIYYVRGDILPIQIINSRLLPGEENIWLKDLDDHLEAPEILRITDEIVKQGKGARIKAYVNAITCANKDILVEADKMKNKGQTLDQILEELGYVAKWEAYGHAKGFAEGRTETAKNMLRKGFSETEIAELSGLDIAEVRALQVAN